MKTIEELRKRICGNCSARSFCLTQEQAGEIETECPNGAWDTEFEAIILRRNGNDGKSNTKGNSFKTLATGYGDNA